jgi:hypothetical protein
MSLVDGCLALQKGSRPAAAKAASAAPCTESSSCCRALGWLDRTPPVCSEREEGGVVQPAELLLEAPPALLKGHKFQAQGSSLWSH